MEIVVEKVMLGQMQVLQFFPVIIIPEMLYMHISFISL
jgi:hypothetical protein